MVDDHEAGQGAEKWLPWEPTLPPPDEDPYFEDPYHPEPYR
jgi:hypothetical protein